MYGCLTGLLPRGSWQAPPGKGCAARQRPHVQPVQQQTHVQAMARLCLAGEPPILLT